MSSATPMTNAPRGTAKMNMYFFRFNIMKCFLLYLPITLRSAEFSSWPAPPLGLTLNRPGCGGPGRPGEPARTPRRFTPAPRRDGISVSCSIHPALGQPVQGGWTASCHLPCGLPHRHRSRWWRAARWSRLRRSPARHGAPAAAGIPVPGWTAPGGEWCPRCGLPRDGADRGRYFRMMLIISIPDDDAVYGSQT